MNSFPFARILTSPDQAIVKKALSLAFAAWLSFAVAALLHVHNAYWAAMPVWVLTQPSRGIVLERALFRVVGTLLGAAAGFALMHIPASPVVQLALLAGWLAIHAGLTHLLRGVHGYAALLSGMTAAVVVIPSVLTPTDTLEIAMARVVCTLIGVIVSTLVLTVLTPVAPLAEFYGQIRAVSAAAVAYALRVLRDGAAADDGREERRILSLISKLESAAWLNAAGSVEGYRRLGDIDLLVVGSLSTMAAAQAIRIAGRHGDAATLAQLERIATHLRRDFETPVSDAERRIATHGDPGLERLRSAVWQILDADVALNRPPEAAPAGTRTARLAPHREWSLAWQAGLTAGVSAFVAAVFALWLGWPPLALAALGVSMFVMVLGSLPLPQLIAPKLMAGVLGGVIVATVYRLAVQPHIDSTAFLLLTLAPFLVAGGFLRAIPRTGIAGIDANMCFLLASQAGMPAAADSAHVIYESGAIAVAAVVMAGGFMLLPRRAQRQAADAATVIRRDLQRITDAGAPGDVADWHAQGARQILRLTLHLGRAADLGDRWPTGLLATLNLGQAVLDLREAGMPDAVKVLLTAMLQQKMPPTETAQALRALAAATAEEPLKSALTRLADTLARAADLLTFGLPAPDASPATA